MVELPTSDGKSTYCIDVREVSAEELAPQRSALPSLVPQFCNPQNRPPGKCTGSVTNAGKLPANCVSWCEGFAFCKLEGKRLCTHSEYVEACAPGGVDYPWGLDKGTADKACNLPGPYYPVGSGDCHAPPVPQAYVHDLVSNVNEWTNSAPKGQLNPGEMMPYSSPTFSGGDGAYCIRAISAVNNPVAEDATIGLRCCADPSN